MSNPERTLALMHRQSKPDDLRSLDQLEAHYRSLAMSSPFAPVVLALQTEQKVMEAGMAARMAINQAKAA